MIRLLFTALLCVLASSQATAQNRVSQALLGLDEDQRNETFTYLLRDSNAKCDRDVQTIVIAGCKELGKAIARRFAGRRAILAGCVLLRTRPAGNR